MDRRTFLGAVGTGAAGLLAGCGGSGDTTTSTTSSTTEQTTTQTTTEQGSTYTVSMEPMGEVSFDAVPTSWVANNGSYADMGLALGVQEPKALWLTGRWHTNYYDEIDGVSADKSEMVSLYQDGVSKERYYALAEGEENHVHVQDPNFLMNRFKGWSESDVEDVKNDIGPFFGNSIFSRGYAWHSDYQYYTLYEAFEKIAQLFQRTDRYEAFATLHDEFQSKLDGFVPTSDAERPQVAVLWATGDQPTSFLPYLVNEGTSFKQWRDLNVRDALAETSVKDFHSSRGSIDYETLLKIDPEYLLLRGHEGKTAEEFRNTVVSFMENHDTASELTAVKNGNVYRGGPLYQGPISNLVLTERGAQQLYGHDEQLFDRQRVADIVNGNL
ncbi:ABC transporter substrate-binding protein [Halarchaeum sp. P4]|uniref:ABC transporter substrate-binding protein n=1 Tax=Halarchaeum sp. P4 TaxID=3421639 RepID=UPI003EC09997